MQMSILVTVKTIQNNEKRPTVKTIENNEKQSIEVTTEWR